MAHCRRTNHTPYRRKHRAQPDSEIVLKALGVDFNEQTECPPATCAADNAPPCSTEAAVWAVSMSDYILIVTIAISATFIVTRGTLFEWVQRRGHLFRCPLCLGFHFGYLSLTLLLAPRWILPYIAVPFIVSLLAMLLGKVIEVAENAAYWFNANSASNRPGDDAVPQSSGQDEDRATPDTPSSVQESAPPPSAPGIE